MILARIALAEFGSLIHRVIPMRVAAFGAAVVDAFDVDVPETDPAEVAIPPAAAASAGSPLTFTQWAWTCVADVLANHEPTLTYRLGQHDFIDCGHVDGTACGEFADLFEWRWHVSPLIAERLEKAGAQHVLK